MKKTDSERLNVVLCWHMHQPQYADQRSGQYALPWTYLHALKDYTDMAAHLEAVPAAHTVVNFAPILIEQLGDYGRQIGRFLTDGTSIGDPLLAALAAPTAPPDTDSRLHLLNACLRANEERLIKRFPAYTQLAEIARWTIANPAAVHYASDQLIADLLVWYHLAWVGEVQRRTDARIARLQDKGKDFSLEDRRDLLAIIGEATGGITTRYARLAERGQVELSTTPYAHPIIPLMLDFKSLREAWPDAPLPEAAGYPGGIERARWHIDEGVRTFERHFGFRPAGCWPAEGSVSAPTMRLLGEAGFIWAATGESVLRNSLERSGHAPHATKEAWLYQPYATANARTSCFFRDDELSDRIGFSYATWHADDAVSNLIGELERIEHCCRGHSARVVSIVLDGENAWEYYPENAYYFLSALYRRLSEHPRLNLTTYSDYLERFAVRNLRTLVAGSWVYGTFSTWMGDSAKNRGWDMLVDAKRAFDDAMAGGKLNVERRAAAERQLSICEGSDWFWWFGDYNPADTVSDFERLYRAHLATLYSLIGTPAPPYLTETFTHGSGAPATGGVMRKGQSG